MYWKPEQTVPKNEYLIEGYTEGVTFEPEELVLTVEYEEHVRISKFDHLLRCQTRRALVSRLEPASS